MRYSSPIHRLSSSSTTLLPAARWQAGLRDTTRTIRAGRAAADDHSPGSPSRRLRRLSKSQLGAQLIDEVFDSLQKDGYMPLEVLMDGLARTKCTVRAGLAPEKICSPASALGLDRSEFKAVVVGLL